MTHQENTYKQFSRQLGQYLAGKGMRVSVERQTLLQFFCSEKRCWTMAELIEEAEKGIPVTLEENGKWQFLEVM